MDFTIIEECINYLQTKQIVKWQQPVTNNDGVITIGYPLYDHRVTDMFNHLSECNFTDFEYLKHIEAIKGKSPDTFSLEECKTYLTFIMRGERFCDGHIDSFIKDGTLLAILLQLKKHLEM